MTHFDDWKPQHALYRAELQRWLDDGYRAQKSSDRAALAILAALAALGALLAWAIVCT